ncbi:conserved oligomeric Golgi complex subunit 5 [Bacillus rossius redtenbacheri]|uniref:conserved oligomeric Golgi complex subunit 5 n=1 Tax=Bacillus rossius redtenbacheri TaxID=93214 RepID=UPI002FDCF7C1
MTECDVWQTIETDDFYKQYLNVKQKSELKSDIHIQGLSVAEQIKKLSDGISLLDKELQRQVLTKHEDLLSQATWVEKLEGVLAVMQGHVQSLLSGVERLRARVVEPFGRIEQQTLVLSRLHATSELLRRVAGTQRLARRLRGLSGPSGPPADLVLAARSLSELAQLSEDLDLSGLEVLEEDQRAIRTHRGEVERLGKLMLTQGLQSQNQAQVGTAIQVFFHLDTLKQSVLQVVQLAEQNVSEKINDMLDVHTLTQTVSSEARTRAVPGRVPMTTSSEVTAFRSRLWAALEQIYDTIYSSCSQVELLQRALASKHGETSGGAQLHGAPLPGLQPEETGRLAGDFWLAATGLLAKRLEHVAHKSSFVKQALEGEYPKFLSHYLELCKRLQASSQLNGETEYGVAKSSENKSGATVYRINRDVVAKFEATYLSRSESRLLDPVDLMFSGRTVPTHEEVDSLVRDMSSQLSASLVDASLIHTVAQNISKIVRMFCSKCEVMIVTDEEATQVIDVSTPGQMMNVSIANLLYYLKGQVLRMFSNMKSSIPEETFSMVLESVSRVDAMTENILGPLLASIGDSIEAIILTMHNEDYSMSLTPETTATQSSKKPEAPCSLYMKELQGFISRAVNNYLVKFDNREIVSKCCLPVASRCVELFLQHVCLIRPLGDGGRMKLASDFAQIELAVAPLCGQLSAMGQSYRLLRSFRPLLFQTVEDISLCPALGEVVPYSLVLLSLFARGPPELPSPHQSANWSVSHFSQWLDAHCSERERLELMSGALQRYQQTVRQKGDTSFHPVYPIMISLLERGVEYAAKHR